jgi:hypothetical protein
LVALVGETRSKCTILDGKPQVKKAYGKPWKDIRADLGGIGCNGESLLCSNVGHCSQRKCHFTKICLLLTQYNRKICIELNIKITNFVAIN